MFVAHTEDAKRYSAPPTFFNEQLMPVLGIRKWSTFDQHDGRRWKPAGWSTRSRRPAVASRGFTEQRFQSARSIDDSPIGEEAYPENGDEPDEAYPKKGYAPRKNIPKTDTVGDTVSGELPTLAPEPIPKKESLSANADGPSEELLQKEHNLIAQWNALQGVTPNRGSASHPKAQGTLPGSAEVARMAR